MRVAITGASGFLGQKVATILVQSGYEVIALCRPGARSPAVLTVHWDMSNGAPPQCESVDAVIHLAQSLNFRSFPEDAPEMFRVNVAAAASLLDWAIAAGASRFVLASSGSVY